MENNNKKNNWRIWEKSPHYGAELYYKRAIGELEEMESAKSLCDIMKHFYIKGMKVLDVGCGAGHYLRTLRKIDKDMDYRGVDATEYYIGLAQKAFDDKNKFEVGDIFNLKFPENSFDFVLCNNVILHLPPLTSKSKAISELIRVAKKYVIIRTVFGERNYLIKEVKAFGEERENPLDKPEDLIDEEGEPFIYNFFNIYSEKYIKDVIFGIDKNLKIKIVNDNSWQNFDNREQGGKTATKVVGGKQVSGNLILDWKFIIIEKL